MRLPIILAAAATLVIAGAAMARESEHEHHHLMHHHYHNASAPIAEGSIPADALSPHDVHMKNLHDSGYDPHRDFDTYGNVQTAQ
jgi:hypothetical protein